MLIGMLPELGLKKDLSQASVVTNLPEGILIVENAGASAKQGVVAAGATAVAMFVGMTVPMYRQTEMRAIEARDRAIEIEKRAIQEAKKFEESVQEATPGTNFTEVDE